MPWAPAEDVHALRQLAQRFGVQSAVSRALALSDTVAAALPRVLEELGTHLGWRFAAFWAVDEAGGVLRAMEIWHVPDPALERFAQVTRQLTLACGAGLPGRVWATRVAHWIVDVLAEPELPRRTAAGTAGLRGALAFPVRADEAEHGALLGVIEVFGPDAVPPNRTLLEAVGGIGYQIGQFMARRHLVEAERAAQARNTAVLEAALDCIVIVDHEGCFLEFNPAAERTFGYRRADVLGRSMTELIVPARLREAHRRGMARYLATGVPRVLNQRLEMPALRADGSEFLSELTIARVPLPGPPIFTAYLRDITEAKARETRERLLLEASALLGSSLDYETTLRTLTSVVIPSLADWYAVDLVEPGGTTRRLVTAHWDPVRTAQAEELARRYPVAPDAPVGVRHVIRTGRSELGAEISEELLGAVAHDDEHLALLRGLGLRSYMIVPMTTRTGIVGAMTFVTAESGRRYDAADLAAAEDLARRASQAVENARLFRELTEVHEQLEQQATELETQAEELGSANDELATANEELRVTNEELMRQTELAAGANRAKSEFLASMSHELRTPLNAILGYVQLLTEGLRGPLTGPQLADLARVERNGRHLLGLIESVLDFAKLESGRMRYHCTDVPLDEVIASAGEVVMPQVQALGLRYAHDRGDPAVTVYADRERLVQILHNLLANAVKFTPAGGAIRVWWAMHEHTIDIHVTDTGIGIPADRLESVFEPFVQVEAMRGARPTGTGLGLAISRDLARAMHGDVTAQSTIGQGSTFTVTLLRRRPEPR